MFNICKAFIRTMPTLQYSKNKPEDLDTDGEDHVADEVRYLCMARPIKPLVEQPVDDYKQSPVYQALGVEKTDLTPRRVRPTMEVIKREE